MDLSLADARAHRPEVIIANDLDADSCAAGIPSVVTTACSPVTRWGALLGWWIAERGRRDGVPATGVYAQSIVSGTLLERIATDAGTGYATTLTGFKWISKVPDLRFGYEEALGYCVDPTAVKDGRHHRVAADAGDGGRTQGRGPRTAGRARRPRPQVRALCDESTVRAGFRTSH